MLYTVGSALMYMERRKLFQVFPESMSKVWDEWELRVLIITSLALQTVLILFGDCRKYKGRMRIRVTLWSAYLMADWIATVSLGVVSRIAQESLSEKCSHGENSKKELMSFWAPFLLLHLGGPDTITAYSLEDNELWLRHLVGLVMQTVVALYIFLLSWPGSSLLSILSIPIFLAGFIKYFERTWTLRSANTQHFRDSMLTLPDPGPNYAKFMDEFTLRKAEGFRVEAAEVKEHQVPIDHPYSDGQHDLSKLISEAYDQFQTFKRLFVDLILSFQDRDNSQSYFQSLSAKQAFDVVEVELGFAFDVFYTKAPVVYNSRGCIFRCFTFSFTSMSLLGFMVLCNKHEYHKTDLVITYSLLVVAILLEIYAVIVMLKSDWTDHWLSKDSRIREPKKKRWSNSMAQYNLLSVCLNEKPAVFYEMQKWLQVAEFLEKHRYKTYCEVSDQLKTLIFEQFNMFAEKNHDPTALCTHKGSFTVKEYTHSLEWFTKIEFDQRILILHIATDLCYYSEHGNNPDNVSSNCKESKHMSEYMLYLLVMCPFMLPIGIGMIRFRDTWAEAMEFFQEKGRIKERADACKKLLQVNTEVLPAKVKGDRSKSVLFDACRLAKSLQAIEEVQKWKFVSSLWVEMLAYAATHCRGHHHAQQLRKGGEFLTHVWLLMAHLGITEQFQIDQGHARAKLITK